MDHALNPDKASRRALLQTALSPVLPQLFGSWFNIWYNKSVVLPLLGTDALRERFFHTCIAYNVVVYPLAVLLWLLLVFSIRSVLARLLAHEPVEAAKLLGARRRAINLPWWGGFVCAVGWLLCVPVFLLSLAAMPGALPPMLWWHLPISFLVSAFISITHSFFLIELQTHKQIFPVLFAEGRADRTPGGVPLSIRGHGLLWAISIGICPIGSLLLLSYAPPAPGTNPAWFATFVGSVGIVFGLFTAIMIGRLVAEPIDQLRLAAQAVAEGDLTVEVPLRRADEFGLLASEFNRMVRGLREKERLSRSFGLHVGRRAAEQILARDPGLSGTEQVITVMFVDIRAFTKRAESCPPAEIVQILNSFLEVMVDIVEARHGGMINKFLGDGFIALFGVGESSASHAASAVRAGVAMVEALRPLNAQLASRCSEPLAVGIGLHTGPAIVGSIGSPDRLEFTAIGSTVNIASRVEGLTKIVGVPFLFTGATRSHLDESFAVNEFPPQALRGVDEPMPMYGVSEGTAGAGI